MVLRKGEFTGYFFDGLSEPEIEEAALATTASLLQESGHQNAQVKGLPSQKQYDSWSCGHRIILIFRHLLSEDVTADFGEGCYEKDLGSIVIPSAVVSNNALFQLCIQTGSVKPEVQIKKEFGAPCPAPLPASCAKAKEGEKPKATEDQKTTLPRKAEKTQDNEAKSLAQVKAEQKEKGKRLQTTTTAMDPPESASQKRRKSSKASAKEPQKINTEPEVETPRASRKIVPDDSVPTPDRPERATKKGKTDKVQDEVLPELDEAISDLLAQRKEKRRLRQIDEITKKLLAESGLDHNTVFQKAHAGIGGKGHWSKFKEALAGQRDITCPICQNLMLKYSIKVSGLESAAETDDNTEAENVKAFACNEVVPYDGGDCEGQLAAADEPEACHKRARRGRPRKDQKPTFDLKEYIGQERAGVYQWLSEEEARDLLPAKEQDNAQKLAAEMKKNPIKCLACNLVLHFRYLSNDLALNQGWI